MNLITFFETHTVPEIAEIAIMAGTTIGYLRLCKYGKRRMSADLAIWLEHVTQGELTACELRPDLPWPNSQRPL